MQQLAHLYVLRQSHYQLLLTVIGLGLLGCSFIYLIAANWWMIPSTYQLMIAPCLLIFSAFAALYFTDQAIIRQALNGLAALSVGLSLAVIGQVYQAGADSYQLFLIWSCMLLPWMLQRNAAVFVILMTTVQLSLYLYFKQTYVLQAFSWALTLLLNIVSLIYFFCCLKYYPILRYLVLIYFGVISIFSMLLFLAEYGEFYHLLSVFFLPMLSLLYFYLKKHALEMSLSALIIAVSITILIVYQISNQYSSNDMALFVVMAIIIFAWCATITWSLSKLIPNTHFHVIPMAFGAWLSGILLSLAMLGLLNQIAIVVGGVIILCSAVLLKSTQHIFLRQFAYCLMICAQAAMLWHAYVLWEAVEWLLCIQLLILALTVFLSCHWFFVGMQWVVVYVLIQLQLEQYLGQLAYSTDHASVFYYWMLTINLCFFSALLIIHKIKNLDYRNSLLLFIYSMIMISGLLRQISFNIDDFPVMHWGWPMFLICIWVAGSWYLILKPQLNRVSRWGFVVLAMGLGLIGSFEIFIVLLMLAYAQSQRVVWAVIMGILVLCYLMFLMYYNLEMSFLFKSATMFLSAILLIILATVLKKNILLKQNDIALNMHSKTGEQKS